MSEPTIEELQNQILDLQQKNEELNTQLDATKEELDSKSKDLTQARQLNSKLFQKTAVGGESPEMEPEEPHKETEEEFLMSFIKPNAEHMKKIYGSDKVADLN